jgi:hypothetical protein
MMGLIVGMSTGSRIAPGKPRCPASDLIARPQPPRRRIIQAARRQTLTRSDAAAASSAGASCRIEAAILAAIAAVATSSSRGAQTALRELGDLFAALVAVVAGPLHGIGLSITGPVDTATGIVDNPPPFLAGDRPT